MDEAFTEANNGFEKLTEKYYEAGARVDKLLEPVPVPPTSLARQRVASLSSSFLNNAMLEVHDCADGRVQGEVS